MIKNNNDRLQNIKVNYASILVMVQTILKGFLIFETIYLVTLANPKIVQFTETFKQPELTLLGIFIISILIFYYISKRHLHTLIINICKNYRIDIAIFFCLGISFSYLMDGIGSHYYTNLVNKFTGEQLFFISLSPIVVFLVFFLQKLINRKLVKSTAPRPQFLNDFEIENIDDDHLKQSASAKRFANRVLNNFSKEPLICGIDAPWGIGKSSFLKLCIDTWNNDHSEKVIVYEFNPLQYESRRNLLEIFTDGLINKIQSKTYSPELNILLSKYSTLISNKASLSFLGLKFEPLLFNNSIEDIINEIKTELNKFNFRIIITIDDLDRLPSQEIEDILFTIKKGFSLPNVSFILCYDNQNLLLDNARLKENEKINEFLEKFINLKMSIFLDSNELSDYVAKDFELLLNNNCLLNPNLRQYIIDLSAALDEIFKSQKFHSYQYFLSDLRKLKRLVNTIILFDSSIEFQDSDFNKKDLINLLLIYINYPQIFRKIYDTETNGRNGFFSLINDGDSAEKTHINSQEYINFCKTLTTNAKFLLGELFEIKESEITDFYSTDWEVTKIRHSSACFNSYNNRNF